MRIRDPTIFKDSQSPLRLAAEVVMPRIASVCLVQLGGQAIR